MTSNNCLLGNALRRELGSALSVAKRIGPKSDDQDMTPSDAASARNPAATSAVNSSVSRADSEISESILWLRGERVLLDATLAHLYGVSAKQLNQAVRRNLERFPSDFVFRLTAEEAASVRQPLSIAGRGGRRHRPYAFTEHGVAMLSTVLRSPRAVAVNIGIMRAFVRLRRWLLENRELAERLDALEQRYDDQFTVVFDAIRELMKEPAKEPGGSASVRTRRSKRVGARVTPQASGAGSRAPASRSGRPR